MILTPLLVGLITLYVVLGAVFMGNKQARKAYVKAQRWKKEFPRTAQAEMDKIMANGFRKGDKIHVSKVDYRRYKSLEQQQDELKKAGPKFGLTQAVLSGLIGTVCWLPWFLYLAAKNVYGVAGSATGSLLQDVIPEYRSALDEAKLAELEARVKQQQKEIFAAHKKLEEK